MVQIIQDQQKYFAKSPSTGVESKNKKMESNFLQNQNIILNELVPLYEKKWNSEKPDIWVLSGAVNITAKILEMVDSCRDEVIDHITRSRYRIS